MAEMGEDELKELMEEMGESEMDEDKMVSDDDDELDALPMQEGDDAEIIDAKKKSKKEESDDEDLENMSEDEF